MEPLLSDLAVGHQAPAMTHRSAQTLDACLVLVAPTGALPGQVGGRLRLLEARAALACGHVDRVSRILAGGIVPNPQEGETALSDLWARVFADTLVPVEYDFRIR